MSQEDMEGFVEKKPKKLPSIGDKLIVPADAESEVEVEVVELRGPHVVVELPNGKKMLGKYGSCTVAGRKYDSVWFYNAITDEEKT